MKTICVASTICEEDSHWIDLWLSEMDRLQLPFAIHLDRCSAATRRRFASHPACIGITAQDNTSIEYNEKHKQEAFDIAAKHADIVLHWDVDEIWERDAPRKLQEIAASNRPEEHLRVGWVNCWNDQRFIRIDTLFQTSRRVKLYHTDKGRRQWTFDHPITYGCKLQDSSGNTPHRYAKEGDTDLVCLHMGLMTRELRELHKARWDRIYTHAVGNNPYGFWDYCVKETEFPPTIIENPYL